jgi:membrane-bound lytic murein transglycosylase B
VAGAAARLLAGALLLLAAGLAQPAAAASQTFAEWLDAFRPEARARGIDDAVFDTAFAGVVPIDRVIELDRRQPEFVQTFWRYMDTRVTDARVERGRALLAANQPLLAAVQARYRVQPRFLVAFWGLESSFGDDTGSFPLVAAVASLAYDARRAGFFRAQLLDLLELIQAGDVPVDATGSWAGAMGQMQFIPSTFRAYAVDFDGDGRRDLWNSLPDIFASAANYLASIGWDGDSTWGREVMLPVGFDYALSGLDDEQPLAAWAALGVVQMDGAPLPDAPLRASLLLPGGINGGPALLVYRNYRRILNWNNAQLYAVSVGHLADRLVGGPPFATPRYAEEVPMSRGQIVEMQLRLERLGLDTGGADGKVGARTREAIKGFQQRMQLPADGHPTVALLEQLRQAEAE